jgi:hypothetical protein
MKCIALILSHYFIIFKKIFYIDLIMAYLFNSTVQIK